MTEVELIKGLKYLGVAYGKEFDKDECQVYYDFLRDYSYDIFRVAVKNIIRKSKFLPKITELVEECELGKENKKFEILEFMNSKGYFKCVNEMAKATMFLERNIIPEWFRVDMERYYGMMKQELIEAPERLMIGD